jgi:hypothetical protein
MDNRSIENLRAERARIDMMRRAVEAMNFEPTRASSDVWELLSKLVDHYDATEADLAHERKKWTASS